ncbi:putative endonuclease [Achromobacter phage JWF]|uniref:putative endonuclease n=1 Tax=Achromobacter phage JWF TaxID=1589748 RepID=UPI000588E3F2|nr:putative endonuclease [Achromobacter phage JWF]AJD82898.1 putative endonuclease [Achromobacter phage JWF]
MARSFRNLDITHAQIREMFDYDPETGVLTRRNSKRPQFEHSNRAQEGGDGYITHYVVNGNYSAHHIIWFWWYGEHFVHGVDHADNDRTNNRISNLRDLSHRANCWNTKTARKGSNLIGAALQKNGKFLARIKVVDRQVTIGTFDSELESHEAYMAVKALIHKPEDEGLTYEKALERIQGLLDKHRKYKTSSNTSLC